MPDSASCEEKCLLNIIKIYNIRKHNMTLQTVEHNSCSFTSLIFVINFDVLLPVVIWYFRAATNFNTNY